MMIFPSVAGMAGAAAIGSTGAYAAAATGRSLISQGRKAAKTVGKKAKAVAQNPKVHKPVNAAGDFVSSALPTGTPAPSKTGYAGGFYGQVFDVEDQVNEGLEWIRRKRKKSGCLSSWGAPFLSIVSLCRPIQ